MTREARGRGVGRTPLKRCAHLYWQLDFMLLYGRFEVKRALGPYYPHHGFSVLDAGETTDRRYVLTGRQIGLGVGPGAGGAPPPRRPSRRSRRSRAQAARRRTRLTRASRWAPSPAFAAGTSMRASWGMVNQDATSEMTACTSWPGGMSWARTPAS